MEDISLEEAIIKQILPLYPIILVEAEHLQDDLLHLGRDGRVLGKLNLLLLHEFDELHLAGVEALEGVLAEAHVVERNPERPDVTLVRVLP